MTDKRLFLAVVPFALLAACGEEAPADDSRSASGEVLEGTISDAMLPLDRVQSEPPLEDPEAFAEAQEKAAEGEAVTAEGEGTEEGTAGEGVEIDEAPAAELTPEPAD